MNFDLSKMSPRDSHHLMVDVVSPRPIAWVSTIDKNGKSDIAPFSEYTFMSALPPVVGVGIGTRRNGVKKHTLLNIEATHEFVINIVNEQLAAAMNATSFQFPPEVNKFEEVRLTPIKSELVAPPCIQESPVSLECRVLQILRFGKEPMVNSFVVGEVLLVHVKDEVWEDSHINPFKVNAIGRLGGGTDLYCRTRETFLMESPKYQSDTDR